MTATSASAITDMSTAAITITKHDKHQVTTAAMKTISSLHVIAAGAGNHHQRQQR